MDDDMLTALEDQIGRVAERCRALGSENIRLARENAELRREREELASRVDRILSRLERP
jgi:hypothetical protein